MPKSKLSGTRLAQAEDISCSKLLKWEYDLVIDNNASTLNLKPLLHKNCNVNNPTANRYKWISQYVQSFEEHYSSTFTNASLYNSFLKFRNYLIWCDTQCLDPFTEECWKAHHSYLWELVLVYEPRKPSWTYNAGDTLGLNEKTANMVFDTTKQALLWCNTKVFSWCKQLRPFKFPRNNSHQAYSENELPVVLDRLSSYFFQLAFPLLEDSTKEEIVVSIADIEFTVPVQASSLKRMSNQGLVVQETAFNQAMSAGYYLLSFFTAFNTSQLLELQHPLELEKDKTSEFYKLKAFKRRANRDVISYVGGQVHKKSLKFIEVLQALSLRYLPENNNQLLYCLDKKQNFTLISSRRLQQAKLSNRLLLLSDQSPLLIQYLDRLHQGLLATSSQGYVEFDKIKIKNRVVTHIPTMIKTHTAQRFTTLSFTLLQIILATNPRNHGKFIRLKGAILPVKVKKRGEQPQLIIAYSDGKSAEYFIDSKYLNILDRIEKFANTRQSQTSSNPRYLLPFGLTNKAEQWYGLAPELKTLSDYGIGHGQLLVNLTASRFRETAAKIARRKLGRTELEVSQILNNQYHTTIKHYSEGNRYDNQLIMSQALQVMEGVSKGLTIDEAKNNIVETLGIKVLKFDELHKHGLPLTGIGTACSQEQQTNQDMPCFDYEKCIKCSHAKLVDSIEPVYRLLSFVECMEESWLYYPERYAKNIGHSIELYKSVIQKSLSPSVIQQAQEKLDSTGRHPLWNSLDVASLGFKGV